jgi:hypothetical protein
LWNGRVFGKGATVPPLKPSVGLAENLVTGSEPRDILTDRLNLPRHIRSRNRVLWFEQPGPHQAQDVGPAGHDMPHIWMDGSRANSHKHLAISDHRLCDFSEL